MAAFFKAVRGSGAALSIFSYVNVKKNVNHFSNMLVVQHPSGQKTLIKAFWLQSGTSFVHSATRITSLKFLMLALITQHSDRSITGCMCWNKVARSQSRPLHLCLCLSLPQTRSSAPAGSRDPRPETSPPVCCSVSVTQWCCVSSKRPAPHPPLTSSSPATHVTDNTTGSDTDNPQYLMTGASLSLSLSLFINLALLSLPPSLHVA